MAILLAPYVHETLEQAMGIVENSHTSGNDFYEAKKELLQSILKVGYMTVYSRNSIPGKGGQGLQELVALAETIIADGGVDYKTLQPNLKLLALSYS